MTTARMRTGLMIAIAFCLSGQGPVALAGTPLPPRILWPRAGRRRRGSARSRPAAGLPPIAAGDQQGAVDLPVGVEGGAHLAAGPVDLIDSADQSNRSLTIVGVGELALPAFVVVRGSLDDLHSRFPADARGDLVRPRSHRGKLARRCDGLQDESEGLVSGPAPFASCFSSFRIGLHWCQRACAGYTEVMSMPHRARPGRTSPDWLVTHSSRPA